MSKFTYEQIWACPMGENDAGASCVGAYMLALARQVWIEDEEFSGKRPFGNSSWWTEVYEALVDAGHASDADSAQQVIVKMLDHFLAGDSLMLKVTIRDSDLPDSLQGMSAPDWWSSSEDSGAGFCCDFGCENCQ